MGPKHCIFLFEEENSVRKKIRSAVTDSGDTPTGKLSKGVENLIHLIKICGAPDIAKEQEEKYLGGETMYAPLKEVTTEVVLELTNSMRTRREDIHNNKKEMMAKVFEMSEHARDIASQTLQDVRRFTGLPRQYMFHQRPERKALRKDS